MIDMNAIVKPQGCTNFRLRHLVRQVSRHYDAEVAQSGLKTTQYSLLSHVMHLGPIRPGDLAKAMGVDASTLTRNLKPMVAAGWLTQGEGSDARSRLVEITDAGRRQARRGAAPLAHRAGEAQRAAGRRAGAGAACRWSTKASRSLQRPGRNRPRENAMNDKTTAGPAPVARYAALAGAAGRGRHLRPDHGVRQTMGLFLSSLNTSTGLGIGSISLAFAFGQLWWGLTQPFAGAVADRIGTGRVIFIGVLLVALGTFLTPLMTTTARPDLRHRRAGRGRRGHGRALGADGRDHAAGAGRTSAAWPPAS